MSQTTQIYILSVPDAVGHASFHRKCFWSGEPATTMNSQPSQIGGL